MPFTPGRPITEAEAELFKALAHPARVRVLELLAEREHTMGELAAKSGLEPSHLSQHVNQLRRTGIVVSRREGSSVVSALSDPQIAELLWLARQIIGSNLKRGQALLAALEKADDAVNAGLVPA